MKLTNEQIEAAREMRAKKVTFRAIGAYFGCSKAAIRKWLKPREKRRSHKNDRESRARVAAMEPQILAALADSPMTSGEIAVKIGAESHLHVSAAVVSMERRQLVDREGSVKIGKNSVPVWRLPREDAVTQIAPPVIRPALQYRTPLSEFMGEPPIGRSALDQRMRA